jgi:hypothetical protein
MSPQILFFVMPGTMKWKNHINNATFVPQFLFYSLAKAPRRKAFYGTQIFADLHRFSDLFIFEKRLENKQIYSKALRAR